MTAKSVDIIGVHIRRTDHVQYEEALGYGAVTRYGYWLDMGEGGQYKS